MINKQITFNTTNRIKNIMRNHINNRTAKSTTIDQIMFEIANKKELDALVLWDTADDLPELASKANFLYEKYYNEYYMEATNND